jgi:UDP-N-acetylglucosamine acyltransferase
MLATNAFERIRMSIAASARIHPTAVIDPDAELADGVHVGPHAVIEGPVIIGPNCTIRAHAVLIGPMTMGQGNDVGHCAILGDRPQHLAFTGKEQTRTEIGDFNVFRESSTVHRGSTATGVTILGSHNYLMVNSHIGHDCRIGSHIMLANGALMAGHCEIQDRAFVSGNSGVHQFCRIGRLGFLSGNTSCTRDLLPFMLMAERDQVVGINKVGLQRAGVSVADIRVVRQAFRILFREKLLQKRAIEKMEQEIGEHPLVVELLQFIRSSKRGFVGGHHLAAHDSESEAA